MAKKNYSYEKHARELEKEKRKRKSVRKNQPKIVTGHENKTKPTKYPVFMTGKLLNQNLILV